MHERRHWQSQWHTKKNSTSFESATLPELLAKTAKNRTMVTMDKILPIKLEDGSEAPDYQAYIGLAWLRHIGAVKQNGRQGYTISKPSDLMNTVTAEWLKVDEFLPTDSE